nr:immunoglobulin light chain junction region [Macaca mulatta]MOY11232.1 immunoglobulin light chain junction region [Macaca mulatta]MOY12852.1 immunoglobulin light chain junction region [Macaca mulatta]MOY13196.1 immunoglobulin light chain junction region [Macaca mulatta]MOY13242.1 immunoglobulin light chain junction region [Macaca mulatta]
CLQDYNPPWTF